MLGLISGVVLFFLIELWFTIKWVLVAWVERRSRSSDRGRLPRKPLYKLDFVDGLYGPGPP